MNFSELLRRVGVRMRTKLLLLAPAILMLLLFVGLLVLVLDARSAAVTHSADSQMSNLLATAGSYGKRVLSVAREGFAQLQQGLGGLRSARPADDEAVDGDFAEVKDHLSERSITSQLLRISLVALLLKALHSVVDRKWLLAVSSGISSLFTSPIAMWLNLDILLAMAVPFLCGIAMLVITWYTVFLDSYIPGVYSSPSESKKKKLFSWPTPFHIGHTIALVNMLFLSFLSFFCFQNSSEFQSS